MNEKSKRPRFTEEFKADAVRLALSESVPTARVACDLGVHPNTLYNWVAKHCAEHAGERPTDAVSDDEREELRRLRREVRILKEEREILKKAAAFFAKESR